MANKRTNIEPIRRRIPFTITGNHQNRKGAVVWEDVESAAKNVAKA